VDNDLEYWQNEAQYENERAREIDSAFYNSKEEYAMADKRTYKEVLASLETHIIYIGNHLKNIDSHMGKINDTNLEQELKIGRNKDRISLGYKIGGGIALIALGGVVTVALKVLGVY